MQVVVINCVSLCRLEEPPADACQQLEPVLETLHVEGYVVGNLRCPNILFDEKNKVNLIDFDWAGPFDTKIRDALCLRDFRRRSTITRERKVAGQMVIMFTIR